MARRPPLSIHSDGVIGRHRYQNFVEAICRGPGEHVIRRAIGESGVDARERDEKIDDKTRLHTGPAAPHVADRTGR